eukprot:scaffold15840_cov32-Tisochrysis_lutea.AAC.1
MVPALTSSATISTIRLSNMTPLRRALRSVGRSAMISPIAVEHLMSEHIVVTIRASMRCDSSSPSSALSPSPLRMSRMMPGETTTQRHATPKAAPTTITRSLRSFSASTACSRRSSSRLSSGASADESHEPLARSLLHQVERMSAMRMAPNARGHRMSRASRRSSAGRRSASSRWDGDAP